MRKRIARTIFAVIPGRPKAERGIHSHELVRRNGGEMLCNVSEYGFRARDFVAPE
jgi:hypothetical protein